MSGDLGLSGGARSPGHGAGSGGRRGHACGRERGSVPVRDPHPRAEVRSLGDLAPGRVSVCAARQQRAGDVPWQPVRGVGADADGCLGGGSTSTTAADGLSTIYRASSLRWDGATWTEVFARDNTQLRGVWGSAADDVWFVGGDFSAMPVGTSGIALHWTAARSAM